MPPTPTAVLFDVGGTLLGEARFELATGFGAVIPGEPARAGELAAAFLDEMIAARAGGGELPVARWLAARLGGGDEAEIEDRIRAAAVGLVPAPGTADVLARLAGDGVPMAAVSNSIFTARALAAELARHGLCAPLAFVLSSADFGARKPARAIFQAALARLGVSAGGAWFVGDSLTDDIAGAAGAGLQPFWLCADPAREAPPDLPLTRVRSWPEFLAAYEQTAPAPRPPRAGSS